MKTKYAFLIGTIFVLIAMLQIAAISKTPQVHAGKAIAYKQLTTPIEFYSLINKNDVGQLRAGNQFYIQQIISGWTKITVVECQSKAFIATIFVKTVDLSYTTTLTCGPYPTQTPQGTEPPPPMPSDEPPPPSS